MTAPVSRPVLEWLWDALCAAPSSPFVPPPLPTEIIRRGWLHEFQLEDRVWDAIAYRPPRGGVVLHTVTLELLGFFGGRVETRFNRPRVRDKTVMGHQALPLADFAALLIGMERGGFSIDPSPVAAQVRPLIAVRRFLTRTELTVFWYLRERHCCVPLALGAPGKPAGAIVTPTGYGVERYDDSAGICGLTVTRSPGRRGHKRSPERSAAEAWQREVSRRAHIEKETT